MNSGNLEGSFEKLLSLCPVPPTTIPLSASHPVPSGASRTYERSLALSLLPSPSSLSDTDIILLQPFKETLTSFEFLQEIKIKETFAIQDGQFREDTHYRILEKLGSGCFGVCYKATTNSGSFTFCLKTTDYSIDEILALQLARKENITQVVGYFGTKLQGRKAVICMEYMAGGTLERHIERQRKALPVGAWPVIAAGSCFVFVGDVLKGLAFLNSKGLVHGDIKADNVLLDESRTHVKLVDFGLARNIEEHVGTPDVLRTGRLHIEMLNGESSSILDHFLSGDDYQRLKSVFQEKFPPQASEETKDLLNLIFGSEQLLRAADILRIATVLN